MERTVFSYNSYRQFISDKLRENKTRGIRSQLSKSIGCHLAYISQVLKGQTHFTLEQAVGACNFFGLNQLETDFFILLVSFERSGTNDLKQYYQKKINEILNQRTLINSRVKADKVLKIEDEVRYYSSWYYIAIDVLTSIEQFQTIDEISTHLKIKREEVVSCLNFLLQIGVIKQSGNKYEVGAKRMHLPSSSHLISKHHINWRMRAINSMEFPKSENLHFSTVYSFSKKDRAKLKEMILKLIEQMEPIILNSPSEVACCFGFDFFEI